MKPYYENICSIEGDNLNCLPLDYEKPRKSKRPRKWPPVTPALHNKIRKLYVNKACCSGEVNEFAEKHGLPRWKITRYAQEMGWTAKHKKQPKWTDVELRILKQSAHCSPHTIQRRLKNKGFERSLVGIALKRKRMRFLSNLMDKVRNL